MQNDDHDYSVDAARAAAERDELGDFVARFLRSPGSDNAELAEELHEQRCGWLGPIELPIDQLNRLAGPPGEPVLVPVDEDHWDERVSDMADRIREGWTPPPVVVTWRNEQLVLEDGNHRVESLRQADVHTTWALVGFEDLAERDRFVEQRS